MLLEKEKIILKNRQQKEVKNMIKPEMLQKGDNGLYII